jgi:Na+/melibiose symporter-like transporter
MLGLNLSIARAGSFAADWSPTFAKPLYDSGLAAPLWLAAGLALASLAAAIAAHGVEARAGKRYALGAPAKSERFEWSEVLRFDRSYWFLVGLCVAIYSVLFPFRSTFAIAYFQDAHDLSREAAGRLNSWVFLAAIFATPLFGWLFDREGRRTGSLAAGSLLLLPVFPILIWTDWSPWTSNVLLGIAFSLVPAVLWPCVARMVDARRLGTAYGLMTMVQNVGLAGFNLAAGVLNDANGAGPDNARGYYPMLGMFALLSLAALAFAALLHRETRGGRAHDL